MASIALVAEKVGLQLLLEPQSSAVIFRGASNVVGLLHPVYQTYKVIEAPSASREQQNKWLTYWAAYGTLMAIEKVAGPYVSWFPYYQHIKFAALLWLQLPDNKGARQLYEKLLLQFLPRYERKLDICLDRAYMVLGHLYNIYKVPLDAGLGAAAVAWAQIVAFAKWISTPDDADGKNGRAAQQHLVG